MIGSGLCQGKICRCQMQFLCPTVSHLPRTSWSAFRTVICTVQDILTAVRLAAVCRQSESLKISWLLCYFSCATVVMLLLLML